MVHCQRLFEIVGDICDRFTHAQITARQLTGSTCGDIKEGKKKTIIYL